MLSLLLRAVARAAGERRPVDPCTLAHAPTSRSEAETAEGGAPPNLRLIKSTCVLLLLLLLYVAATATVCAAAAKFNLVRVVAATAAVLVLRPVE